MSLFIAPICGLIVDYQAHRNCCCTHTDRDATFTLLIGYTQRMFNFSILQLFTWLTTIILCIVCMFQSIVAATAALCIFVLSRTMLVAGCQAMIVTM